MKQYQLLFILLIAPLIVVCQQPRLIVPIGHTAAIVSVAYSPSGRFIVTGSEDGTAKIWDSRDGKLLMDIRGEKDDFRTVFYTADERYIISRSYSKVFVWDASTGNLIYDQNTDSCSVYVDGKPVVVCSPDSYSADGQYRFQLEANKDGFSPRGNYVIIWDIATSQKKMTASIGENTIESVSFHPAGKQFATHDHYTLRIWDIEQGKGIKTFNYRLYSNKVRIKYLPGGKRLLVQTDNTVEIFDTESGKVIAQTGTTKGKIFSQINDADFHPGLDQYVVGSADAVKVRDLYSGDVLFELKGNTDLVKTLTVHPNNNVLAVVLENRRIGMWNFSEGIMLNEMDTAGLLPKQRQTFSETILRAMHRFAYSAAFSPDGKRIVASFDDKIAYAWNLDTKKHRLFISASKVLNTIRYDHTGDKAVVTGDGNIALITDGLTGSIKNTLEEKKSRFNYAEFSPDGAKIITALDNDEAKLWQGLTLAPLKTLKGHKKAINVAKFSPDGNYIITASEDKSAIVWNLQGDKISVITGKFAFTRAEIDNRNENILAISGGVAGLWRINDGKNIILFAGHRGKVNEAIFSKDGQWVFTASEDNTTKCWNTATGSLAFTLIMLDKNNYLTVLPDGYYRCSQGAARQLYYVTPDFRIITFEQLDIKYNRPDKVLIAAGSKDEALIQAYYRAYVKRIRKLNIDTTMFSSDYDLPEADIINAAKIEKISSEPKVSLHIKASDRKYRIDRLNIWINGVPVFGSRGISYKKRDHLKVDTTISINLATGKNIIEISVMNENGIESYRKSLNTVYNPVSAKVSKVYFIGIAVDHYKNTNYDLAYSVKDIKDLAFALREKYKERLVVDTLFDKNVTKQKILALRQKLAAAEEDDIVIMSFSGHGLLSNDFSYYLSTYNIDFDQPEKIGLAYDDFETIIDNIRPIKKLVFIDACHSGEIDKEELERINAVKTDLKNAGVNTKGVSVSIREKQHFGLKNSFELMQSLFVNVGRGTGATIISAAAGTQFAIERKDLSNGVFTYSIVELIRSSEHLKVSELKQHVAERVTALTSGLQRPTFRSEASGFDWQLW